MSALGEEGLNRAVSLAQSEPGKLAAQKELAQLRHEECGGANSCFALRVGEAVLGCSEPDARQIMQKTSLESLMLDALQAGLLPKWNLQNCPEVGRMASLLQALQSL